ncbi:hypothetical protein REPUB_Repub14bG0026900 [Reevesia pubescens]
MLEPPFRPREKLIEYHKYFQSIHKHTYLKGLYDKIIFVAILDVVATSSFYLIVSMFPLINMPLIIFRSCLSNKRLRNR